MNEKKTKINIFIFNFLQLNKERGCLRLVNGLADRLRKERCCPIVHWERWRPASLLLSMQQPQQRLLSVSKDKIHHQAHQNKRAPRLTLVPSAGKCHQTKGTSLCPGRPWPFSSFVKHIFILRLINGSGGSNTAMMWMMGSTLNPSSAAAREMDMVLKSEIASHAAYDPAAKHSYQGLPVPGRKQVRKN